MPKKTADQIAEKFQRRVSQAGPDYDAGVAAADDWLEGYLRAAERMVAELQRALAEGKHKKGAAAAGTNKWKEMTQKKGSPRYTQAAQIAAEEYRKVAGEVLAAAEKAKAAAQALPDTSIEERIQRAAAAMRAIHEHWAGKS